MSLLLVVLFAVHVCAHDYSNFELPIEGRIYGGEKAGEHEFPTQIYYYNSHTDFTPFCGGTILNEWFILTAAHCVSSFSRPTVYRPVVRVGSANISAARRSYVKNVIIHEGYNGLENDIALIKLAEPLVLDGVTVKAAVLPEQDEEPTSSKATVIGAGDTDIFGASSTVLMKMSTELTACPAWRLYSDKQFLCITQGIQKGACHGDSGSPLIVDGKVVGVLHGPLVSACFKHPLVVGYTRVSIYRSWIDLKMKTE